jgi:hypothetical protein
MSDGFAVNAGDLRAHASHVRSLNSQVDKARAASHEANFSSTMFGTIGSKLVWPLMAPLDAAGQESMTTLGEIFTSTADAVENVADEFEVVDGAVMTAWNKMKDLLS